MKIVPFHAIRAKDVVSVLKRNGLVIAPSDTVYGLLVDARNGQAVQKLIAFKNRPAGKPISIFVSGLVMMQEYAHIAEANMKVIKRILPGPFTVIFESKHTVSSLLESERGTLGIRYPDNDFITSLVKNYGSPLTATSANLSSKPPHYSVDSLLRTLPKGKKELVDLVIDKGKLSRNKPSTIVDLTTPTVKILRHGDIVFSDIRTFESHSTAETKKIATFVFEKNKGELAVKPLVFVIRGDLGVGKTIFVKGVAESLGIHSVISPTFVVYYEYPVHSTDVDYLYHFDLYNIAETEELKNLKIPSLLEPRKLFCFEWGEKTGDIIDVLKSKSAVVYVKMEYFTEKKRSIMVKNIK